ncbi:type II toxin-antitoxin system VapC family toxin [Actinophytocola sp.]|uniref:type II toxin-antitoxin system VapC family toxin n=1 Tax=Actinophytocola sp. TaxID=1872138 RepID=UPI002D7E9826|nr:PIN domain-containing protein [Actinophytocola sp.]HET9140950.1 PIN domain-containing protein [Actinophytocola sp.]
MTIVLDSGALTAVAHDRAVLIALRKQGAWPPLVSTAVLAESLTGDQRRDVLVNRILRLCVIREVTELIARHAATLRHQARFSGISAVDAIVAATADHAGGGVVWTSDPKDMWALAAHTLNVVRVSKV